MNLNISETPKRNSVRKVYAVDEFELRREIFVSKKKVGTYYVCHKVYYNDQFVIEIAGDKEARLEGIKFIKEKLFT